MRGEPVRGDRPLDEPADAFAGVLIDDGADLDRPALLVGAVSKPGCGTSSIKAWFRHMQFGPLVCRLCSDGRVGIKRVVSARYCSAMRVRLGRRGPGVVREPSLRLQRALIVALDSDDAREHSAAAAASAGITTRASILIAAAGVTSGLQVSTHSVVPAVLAVVGALVGVSLLLMRTVDEVPILEAEETFWAQPPRQQGRQEGLT